MPIYEYKCRTCAHEFEVFVRPGAPAAKCPSCGKANLEQMISLPVVTTPGESKARLQAARKKNRTAYKHQSHEEFVHEQRKHADDEHK
jgi:putative FmdB family regulatory protein